ncbi:MAG: hypothetical protein LBE92_19160 [Chryseobacterium sp.]|jgi:hypothetical protein|uniref:hypothetical protein n=1 Tax=Chryseobacterium sp. TaxID=1871047 RepID=UPI0028244B3C|nr:hypothetical protein [Chryseobacterium sp.]MDR2238250.1 hypothetical protein [Chryseobacterium sp.]
MIYQIHQIDNNVIIGSVTDTIKDNNWIVVADIPRQMEECNRIIPRHVTLISGNTGENFSKDFERIWTSHMAERLRNWLIREHSEKLYSYDTHPVQINYNISGTNNAGKPQKINACL